MATIIKRNGKWQAKVRMQGHSASKTFSDKKSAEVWAKELELQIERQDLPQNPRERLKGLTLGQLVERYRDNVCPRKKSGENEQIILNAFLRNKICRKPLAQITTKDFAEYRDERLKKVQPTSLRRELNPLQDMFQTAKDEWGMPLKTNPVAELRFTATVVQRDRRLQEGELDRIIEEAKLKRNTYFLPIVLWAIETGMRRSEILNMHWQHVDLKRRLLTIPETKNGHPRVIPLTIKAMEVLEGLDPVQDAVFPVSGNAVDIAWRRLLKKIGIQDLHFHDLRREAISSLFDRGLHIGEVSSISGHRTWSQLKTYTQPRPENILKKLDAAHV